MNRPMIQLGRYRFLLNTDSKRYALVILFLLTLIITVTVLALLWFGGYYSRGYTCSADERFSRDCVLTIAADLELDTAQFTECLEDRKFSEQITQFQSQAQTIGIEEIPTVFFGTGNDRLTGFLVPGGLTTSRMSALLEEEFTELEDLQAYVLSGLSTDLDRLETSLLTLYTSPSGGGLSAEDARIKVREITAPDRERLRQAALLREYPLETGPFVGQGAITAVVFANYECARCREYMQTQLPLLEYGARNGGFRYVFRDIVREPYENAGFLANAAHCAGDQGQFFSFHARLFQQ
ncbi:MAG: hypothetical protein TR69_WS6001000925 [candidate division WS6 bacterium OLB20]|uniref:Thioredoxin-like fold domain-containing protein n=1 Tax=candidate division WS6 bacterium OLB20 TaxID=1617426 RepID=A0A136LZ28_9BACT|nr:MAG: hypothetical protein TR69_WS6001000925 [candidate division WS6 bacterium OLB20]